jgi:hypothetical protein
VIQDIIVSLVSFFVVELLQTELSDKLAAARAVQAVISQVSQCARAATPVLAERVTSDPWWGVATTARTWAGTTAPETVLGEAAPSCAPALQAVRPSLRDCAPDFQKEEQGEPAPQAPWWAHEASSRDGYPPAAMAVSTS